MKNNNCKNRREAIAALILGELETPAADEIKKHIDTCMNCRSLYRAMVEEEETIRSAFKVVDDRSKEIGDKLIAQVDRNSHKSSQGPTILRWISGGSRNTSRTLQLSAAAAIAIILLGGITFWPFRNPQDREWWLGSPAAIGQEIIAKLEKIAALTYRQRAWRVMEYGPDEMSGLWERRYAAKDKYRSEVLDEANNITHIQWTLPQGEGYIKYEVWPEHRCYTQKPEKYPPFYDNVMGWLQRWVRLLTEANRILGTQAFEGRECVGFEISPGTYDGFLVQVPVHVWFDVETKLPVRVERRGLEFDYDPGRKLTLIYDQFDYYAQVPTDMFTLEIPDGFVNAHPDEINAAKKGLVFADIPEGLRDEIISTLKKVQTVIYQQHLEVTVDGDHHTYGPRKIFVGRYAWREDSHKWETPRKTKWYIIEKKGREDVNSDFGDQNYKLIETIVNFTDETYSVATYKNTSRHGHPMRRLLFLAGLINKADRILENSEIGGIKCFGVEVSSEKYGNNSSKDKHRMWFDTETKLPVRLEFEYWQSDDKEKSVQILDGFEWDPELPDDTFTPKIPEDYTLVDVS